MMRQSCVVATGTRRGRAIGMRASKVFEVAV
jgi:hypothetical protein